MNVLVTGGAGYIGSVVASDLIARGHAVTVYDNLRTGHREAVPPGAELVVADVADRAALDRVMRGKKFDAVMHFAALIEAGESMLYPERFFRNNSVGTLTVLEAMTEHSVPRLVFSSTAAVYGEPEQVPIREDARLDPTNAYGESKLMVERMLHWFHRIHHLRYACLRYFNAAGAAGKRGEAHHPETHLIPLVLQAALGTRESVAIFGQDYPTDDGTCVRDYIHVSDLAQAHVLALEALEQRDRLCYNLGNGRGYSVREVIETAAAVTGRKIKVVESPRRLGDPAALVASSEAIQKELGWQPRHAELATIIGTAWEWLLAHPNGYAADRGSRS